MHVSPAWEFIRRPAASITAVALIAFLGGVALTLRGGIPAPWVQDEFSYLLAGDTFLHGRVTNPTPPAWQHFESPHILVRPTYMSKYPPAQGLFLALGRLVAREAIVGVWISLALACGAIVWMLQAWVPARWAFIGGLIAVLRLVCEGEDGRWSQSYWGGGVAALGGALVLGATRRLWDHGRTRDATVFAVGLVILANSRPFEGLIVSVPMLGALALWLFRQPMGTRLRVVTPMALVLAAAGAAMAFYNARVTGSPLRLPYTEYSQQYSMAPEFLWQTPRMDVAYDNLEFSRLYTGVFLRHFNGMHTWDGYRHDIWGRVVSLCGFFIGAPLVISLAGIPSALRQRWTAFVALTGALMLAGMATVAWYHTHYAAPASAIVALLLVQGLRRVRVWRVSRWPVGRWLAWGTAAACVVTLVVSMWRFRPQSGFPRERAEIARSLEAKGGRHLILVHSGFLSSYHDEWVYDGGDPASEPVVWAHDLGVARNDDVLAAFAGRTVWWLNVDKEDPKLVKYPPSAADLRGSSSWSFRR